MRPRERLLRVKQKNSPMGKNFKCCIYRLITGRIVRAALERFLQILKKLDTIIYL